METFEDENFSAIDYINAAYNASEKQNKEEFVSALLAELQVHVQDVNAVLEDTSHQVIGSMPKIMKDADNLRREALTLQHKMQEMQTEIAQVQRETGSCMANLERLDTLKTKLQVAKQGLQESDGWGRLTSELEDLLERNDVAGGCEKLSILQRSLAAQVGLPGQSEREMHVEEAKNKLEALASPQVVKCFSIGDAAEALRYVEMFGKMERLPQLKQYYRTVQKTRLQGQWQEIVDLAENSRELRLREFYHHLLDHFQKQVKWCTQVFGPTDGLMEAASVISDALAGLQPTREAAITNLLKRQSEKLDVIAEFSAANQSFGTTLMKYIQNSGLALQKDHLVALSKGIYDFFQVFIIQYAALEQNSLSGHLVSLGLSNQVVALETVRSLGNCNAKVIQAASNALQRCESITQNCAIGPLVTVLNSFFREYLDKYKKAQKQLDTTRNVPNVNFLQICTTLLQYLGDFILQLTTFEEEVIGKILTTYEQVCRQESSSFQYKVLRKQDVSEIRKLKNLVNERQTQSDFGSNPWSIFSGLIEVVKPICAEIHDTTLASVFAPIETHLTTIEPTDSSSTSTDLPDYSFAPQEYITQVGQYLMTLPQHLEPFLLSPSDALRRSLEIADEKYSQSATSGDVLLSLIAEECCAMYMENIYKIGNLSNTAAKQLATDIEYLGSVLEELGLKLGSQIQQVAVLLRAAPENYLNLSSGCDPKLVTAIRQMRNIISSE